MVMFDFLNKNEKHKSSVLKNKGFNLGLALPVRFMTKSTFSGRNIFYNLELKILCDSLIHTMDHPKLERWQRSGVDTIKYHT